MEDETKGDIVYENFFLVLSKFSIQGKYYNYNQEFFFQDFFSFPKNPLFKIDFEVEVYSVVTAGSDRDTEGRAPRADSLTSSFEILYY